MKKIVIYGAGGMGRELSWLVETCGGYEVVCIVDDDARWKGKRVNNVPVIGLDAAIKKYRGISMAVGIGSPKTRERITGRVLEYGFRIESIVHPLTEMSNWIHFGEGLVICAGCILTTNIFIGNHVQVNLACTISHDVVMGEFTTLAPGVHVSGWVHFGKRVCVGTGAVFINGTEQNPLIIGDDAVIGAGACVTKTVPSGETWAGVPAKSIK